MLLENSDVRDQVEDQLFWMYKTTYEVEMHINTTLYLDILIFDLKLQSDQTKDMIFYHYELALIRTASILKNKPDKDEKHSLACFGNYLDGLKVRISNKTKLTLQNIQKFYYENQTDISKLNKKRDVEAAHSFKLKNHLRQIENIAISFQRHVEIIHEARILITQLYYDLFERYFPKELEYDINAYELVYLNGLQRSNLK